MQMFCERLMVNSHTKLEVCLWSVRVIDHHVSLSCPALLQIQGQHRLENMRFHLFLFTKLEY